MKKSAIKKQLRKEMEQEYSRLSFYEKEEKESYKTERMRMFMSKNWGKSIAFAAIAIVITAAGIAGFKGNNICTVVAMDVNPSFEMSLDDKEKVIKIDAKNEDARQILGDMDLEKADAEVAMNALIGAMYRQGYLDAQSRENVVLLTVDSKDAEKAKQVETKLTQSIKDSAQQSDSKVIVLSQQSAPTDADREFARQHEISWGRAMFINRLTEQYPEFSKEELAGMTIRNIMAYLKDKQIDYRAFVDCDDIDDIDDIDDMYDIDDIDDMDDIDDIDDMDDVYDVDDIDDIDDIDDMDDVYDIDDIDDMDDVYDVDDIDDIDDMDDAYDIDDADD